MRILLPSRAPASTAAALAAAGIAVDEVTFTRQVALPCDELMAALAQPWDWLVVTSVATVAALQGLDPRGSKIAAVGRSTASALANAGIHVDLVADPGGGAALVAAFPPGPGRILVPGAAEPSEQPAKGLAELGWTVHPVPVYKTIPADIPPGVVADWRAGRFDAFVVTAGSVARAAVAAAGLPGPAVVAIGRPSALAAEEAGFRVAGIAASPDASNLVAAVVAALAGRPAACATTAALPWP